MNASVPDDVFERLAARIVSLIAASLPAELVSLAFASPLSARSPDALLIWHAGYRKRHPVRVVLRALVEVVGGFAKWLVRLIVPFERYGYAVYGGGDTLLVFSSICGFIDGNGEARTQYVDIRAGDAVFVFGRFDDCGKDVQAVGRLAVSAKVAMSWTLVWWGVVAALRSGGNTADRTVLFCAWAHWVLSLQWLYHFHLERSLDEEVRARGIRRIGCIHEMHAYARVVWRVAARHSISSFTVQHASIAQGKRWYFSFPDEQAAGLALPDVFYAYNDDVVRTLAPYFQTTRFVLGCSCRYRRWKDIRPLSGQGRYYLFVTGLARFDNDTVIGALREAASALREAASLRIRLHAVSNVNLFLRRWIAAEVAAGRLEISTGVALGEDIAGARAVIGMSSTVLEEAVLMGKPAIQLCHPDYLMYINADGASGILKAGHRQLSAELLQSAEGPVDSAGMRRRFGLDMPVVDYERLFTDHAVFGEAKGECR